VFWFAVHTGMRNSPMALTLLYARRSFCDSNPEYRRVAERHPLPDARNPPNVFKGLRKSAFEVTHHLHRTNCSHGPCAPQPLARASHQPQVRTLCMIWVYRKLALFRNFPFFRFGSLFLRSSGISTKQNKTVIFSRGDAEGSRRRVKHFAVSFRRNGSYPISTGFSRTR